MSLIWIVNILSVFFLCVFFAGIVIPQILLIAFRRRLFDEPDERKIHQCVVPRLGGMAFKPVVFFSFVLLLAVNVSTGHDELLKEIGAEALPLAYAFCAIIMLYLVGIADDLIGVRYRAKFFIQIVCGIMLVAGGVELSDLHGMLFIHFMPSWISIPLTVFVTVFIINAINLIDGIDGLASGLCSIAFLFYGMTFIWFHQYLYAMLAFATLGVLIPFYYYKEIYIETERIIIRNFKQKDAEGLLEYLSNPRVNCFAGDRLCSEEAAWAYMQYSPKDMLRYAVSLKKDDFIIGDVFALRENEVDIFPFEEKQLVVDTLLSELEPVKQMPSPYILAGFGIAQPKILLDSQVVSDASVVEILDPLLADKLSVGNEGIDTLGAEQSYKSINQLCPLLPVGITTLVKQGKEQWKCDTLVCNSKHEDIDVDLTEFPVGAVKAQNQSCLDRQKRKYHFGDNVKVESIFCKKPLQAAQVGITFNTRRHRRSYLVQADGLHNAKSVKNKRKQFYASQIHYRAKMLLHNRDDWINFVTVPGSCRNFHGKSR